MITYDYSNLMASNIGDRGLPEDFWEQNQPLVKEAHEQILKEEQEGILGFKRLPFEQPELEQIKALAQDARKAFQNLVILGIGGSCLGPLACHQALNHPFFNQIDKSGISKVFFLDNVDPELIQGVLDLIDLKKTLVVVISKSGKTAETLSQFMLFFERIKKVSDPKRHFVIVTDPQKGPLRAIVKEEGFTAFGIPPNVGGRYSVLTPVGLLPAALLGIDVDELLTGAQEMAKRCGELKNPAYVYALTHYLGLKAGYTIQVFMPYVSALIGLADWWRQLWAESLGKDGRGPTPIKALGVTDQHSQLQLYMEGPQDKIIDFVTVKRYRTRLDIPLNFRHHEDLAYLGGYTFNDLIATEQLATEAALTKAGRPNAKFILDTINASNLGGIFYCLELATVCCGFMLKVNPINQPGVELGKRYTQALMGRQAFQKEKEELQNWFLKLPKYQI